MIDDRVHVLTGNCGASLRAAGGAGGSAIWRDADATFCSPFQPRRLKGASNSKTIKGVGQFSMQGDASRFGVPPSCGENVSGESRSTVQGKVVRLGEVPSSAADDRDVFVPVESDYINFFDGCDAVSPPHMPGGDDIHRTCDGVAMVEVFTQPSDIGPFDEDCEISLPTPDWNNRNQDAPSSAVQLDSEKGGVRAGPLVSRIGRRGTRSSW